MGSDEITEEWPKKETEFKMDTDIFKRSGISALTTFEFGLARFSMLYV